MQGTHLTSRMAPRAPRLKDAPDRRAAGPPPRRPRSARRRAPRRSRPQLRCSRRWQRSVDAQRARLVEAATPPGDESRTPRAESLGRGARRGVIRASRCREGPPTAPGPPTGRHVSAVEVEDARLGSPQPPGAARRCARAAADRRDFGATRAIAGAARPRYASPIALAPTRAAWSTARRARAPCDWPPMSASARARRPPRGRCRRPRDDGVLARRARRARRRRGGLPALAGATTARRDRRGARIRRRSRHGAARSGGAALHVLVRSRTGIAGRRRRRIVLPRRSSRPRAASPRSLSRGRAIVQPRPPRACWTCAAPERRSERSEPKRRRL